ncbi:MAG TPA: tetratricopeptide repeat protein [Polyangia bacterium]|nr:tetratricopeptide repeat protein [Polyangia bacterium]
MMVVLWTLLSCASFAQAAEGGAAADDTAAQAKKLYERGMAHFQLAEYDDAIARWQEGFRIKPVPEFLYNIGQAYRLSSRPEKAVQNYRAYLRMQPDATNRAEVERHIASLQKAIDQSRSAATAPPTQPSVPSGMGHGEPPAPSTATPPPPETAPPPATSTTSAPTVAATPASNELVAGAPERKPITKKGWFWGVVAGGAVVVAGAVALGVYFGTKDNTKVLAPLSY